MTKERMRALSVTVFVALLFAVPSSVEAFVLPEKVVLQSGDFFQVVEGDALSEWYRFSHGVVYRRSAHNEVVRSDLCPFASFACDVFWPRRLREHLTLERLPEVREETLDLYLGTLADKVERDPENALLGIADGAIFVRQEALPGRELDLPKTRALLIERLETNRSKTVSVSLAVNEIAPKVSSTTMTSLGIHELIGQGTTDFQGSPKNRIFNIKRALEQYEGALIAPGEEFSFVDLLGEVDGEHGYLPELVIKYNRTEPEFGGGICQVSTTVFRAALNSGLKITMRKNHAYPVPYYRPYGLDATIYIPRPDLRFLNNTPGHILMIPTVEGTKLTFSFYGTKDGRSVTIDGPHILERNPDGSMKTTFTHIVKDQSGKTIIEDAFPSNYKSPDLFPHPNTDPVFTEKPKGWSSRQWKEYKKLHPEIR